MLKQLCTIFSVISYKIKDNFRPQDEMTASRQNITMSNVTTGTVANLITGNFLTGLLLLLNADDGFMGLVTMVGFIGNLFQVLSPLLLERFNSRKKLLILGRGIIYLFNIVVIIIIPFVPGTNGFKLTMMLAVILFVNLVNAIIAPGYPAWHVKSIPSSIRAKYYSFFTVINGVVIYTAILGASAVLDHFKNSGNELRGFVVLRIVALILAVVDIFFLLRIKEYPIQKSDKKISLISVLLDPFKEKKYLITVLIACLWSFAVNIPGPYYMVYLLKEVNVSYSFINVVNILNIPALILLAPIWKKVIDKFSWFKTLYIAMGLFALHYIGLAFVTKKALFIYPIAAIYSYLIAPGINTVFANIQYINCPEKNQTNYLGFYATMNNLAALFAIFLSKELITKTESISFTILGTQMGNKQLIMIFTSIMMLLAVGCIALLNRKSEGEGEG